MSQASKRSSALTILEDDGACGHLVGVAVPALRLESTQGPLGLAALARDLLVLYLYPRTGVPGERPIRGWDAIPGARGCTAQSCAFRDHSQELAAARTLVAGLSAQAIEEQREFAQREQIPFPLLSDPELALATRLGLPTFEAGGLRLYTRTTLIARRGRIVKVFYPVPSPERNAEEALAWLGEQARKGRRR
jgi:peroxiredoxin